MHTARVACLVLFLLVGFASAAPQATIFSDDFSDGNADGWDVISGTWIVDNQEFAQNEPFTLPGLARTTAVYTHTGGWCLTADVRLVESSPYNGRDVGWQHDDQNKIWMQYTGHVRELMCRAYVNGEDVFTHIFSISEDEWSGGDWHNLTMQLVDDEVIFWRDRALLCRHSDPRLLDMPNSGQVFLYTWGALCNFDNVEFTGVEVAPYEPRDYFPLIVGNHWRSYTQHDISNPNDDRWSFVDVADMVTFGIPGETVSYEVRFSESLLSQPDTSTYRTTYYCLNSSGELCWTGFAVPGDTTTFDSALVYLSNPIVLGENVLFSDSTMVLTVSVESVADTLDLPLGQFENCLRVQESMVESGELQWEREDIYIPVTQRTRGIVAGIGRSFETSYEGAGGPRYSASRLDSVLISTDVLALVPPDSRSASRALLAQNYPNPFNPSTVIGFELVEPGRISLSVFDLAGRLIRSLKRGEMVTGGPHLIVWNGRDNSGKAVGSGTYFYRLTAGKYTEMRRMCLIR